MSMHMKTKKYATYGKKSRSRVVEVDPGSGRSNFYSQDSWSSSISSSSNSQYDKENVNQHNALGRSTSGTSTHLSSSWPKAPPTTTLPSTQAQRAQKSPFSAKLLARYALSRSHHPALATATPRSPLAKSSSSRAPASHKEAKKTEETETDRSDDESDWSEEEPELEANKQPQDVAKPNRAPELNHNTAITSKHSSPSSSTRPADAQSPVKPGLKPCTKTGSAVPSSSNNKQPPPPVHMTPFEIVPPTPSIIKRSRKGKASSHSSPTKREKQMAVPPPPALRVRSINASDPVVKKPTTKVKETSPVVALCSDSESEVEVVRRQPQQRQQQDPTKNQSKPPGKSTSRRQKKGSHSTDETDGDDDKEEQIYRTSPSRDPFKSHNRKGPTLHVSHTSPRSSSAIPTAPGPLPTPVKPLVQSSAASAGEVLQTETPVASDLRKSRLKVPSAVEPLLHACGQTQAYDFTSFTQHTSLLSPHLSVEAQHALTWRKLGEATYSEIFVRVRSDLSKHRQLQDDSSMVVKVVPIHLPKSSSTGRGGVKRRPQDDGSSEEKPEETSISDALRELTVTRLMNEDDPGGSFISLLGGHVVQGVYPAKFLDEWRQYKKAEPQKALNLCPDTFGPTQYYLVLCLPYGGVDLETSKLHSWTHAASILWQVAYGLATAERSWHFEHRDLHWGNVLIKNTESTMQQDQEKQRAGSSFSSSTRSSPMRKPLQRHLQSWPACLEPEAAGVKICIIDYSLSSCDDGEASRLHGGLEDDVLFEGSGDYQFDVYRLMREATRSDWEGFYPVTNLMWLHYLTGKLLRHKGLRAPPPHVPAGSSRRKPAQTFTSLNSMSSFDRPSRQRFWHQQQRSRPDEEDEFKLERQAHDALVLAEQALAEAIQPRSGRESNKSRSILSLAGETLGLGEIKDSDGFLTWLSVAPDLTSL